MVSGVVAYTYKQSWEKTVRTTTKVSVTFERQCITSSNCTMCPDRLWCKHIIAVILYRIRHANKVSACFMSGQRIRHANKVSDCYKIRHANKISDCYRIRHANKISDCYRIRHANKISACYRIRHANKISDCSMSGQRIRHANKVNACFMSDRC